ncbi:MAG: ferrous iron transport protein B [Myxococcota bacterium]
MTAAVAVAPTPFARTGPPRVVVAGNPNAGKSTLFNALTGGSAQVGNFPGTTVSTTTGRIEIEGVGEVEFVDLPGTYSLAATSPDERVAMDALLGLGRIRPPDLVLLVADAPRLLRSLYLVLQVLELGVPTVLAVNLLDEARADGIQVQLGALREALNIPVVGTVARSREGLPELRATVGTVLAAGGRAPRPVHGWSETLEADVREVEAGLPASLTARGKVSAIARFALLSADAAGRVPGVEAPIDAILAVRRRAAAAGRDLEAELVGTRYAWIDARGPAFLGTGITTATGRSAERIDRVLLHPVVGPLVFVGVMAVAFTALFSWADPLIAVVEAVFGRLGDLVHAGFDLVAGAVPSLAAELEVVRDLTVDGLIGGVGGVLVFLPQIGLLFLFLALLEDCGYLARAAHLADRALRAAGLPGRAFVPVLSGYACAVPAILATRTMPRYRDRLLTMLVIPLTSCSARLPVYTLMIAALFPATLLGWIPVRPLALAGMYLLSTGLAIAASIALGRTVLRDGGEPVLLELPPYRVPDPRVVAKVVWSRCADFVREAGGLILVATIAMWALLYFPRYEPSELLAPEVVAEATARGDDLDALAAPLALEASFAGRIGHAMEPAIAPLGYDWRIGIGLLGAFAAREVFVSTLGVVYGIGDDVDEDDASLRDRIRSDRRPDGTPTYTPLVGCSLMVFFAFALQCLSTMAVLRKETGGWRWALLAFAWNGAFAWLAALAVYQGGMLLGFR